MVGNTFDDCLIEAQKNSTGKLFIHPFDNEQVIIGQGTIAHEIYQDIEPDVIICTIGGGGLISGILTYINEESKKCIVIGVEPQYANAMYSSLVSGKIITLADIDTFVDGACVKRVGDITFDICNKYLPLDNIKIVSKGKVCDDMIKLYQEDGIIVEPAGVLPISALSQINISNNMNIVCIVSGGNNDILRYQEIMEYSLIYNNIRHYFIIEFKQKPEELKEYILNVIKNDADIIRFEYVKKNNKSFGSVLLGLDIITSIQIIIDRMDALNYKYKHLLENDIMYHMII